jgi:signal peptidase complex subunit 3
VKNEVVIWDRIVRRKEDALVNVAGRNKYVFRDLSRSFK